DCEYPCERPADGALGAPTDELEVGVEARHGRATRQVPDDATDRQEPAESDDERWHADVGDDEPLERTDRGTERDADSEGDGPAEREVRREAEDIGKDARHEQGVRH